MRVVLVAPFLGFSRKNPFVQVGGAEKSIHILLEELRKKIEELYIITNRGSKLSLNYENVTHLPIHSWKASIIASKIFFYKDYTIQTTLKKIRPDIIDLQDSFGAGLYNSHLKNLPFVQTIRDYWFMCPQKTLFNTTMQSSCNGPTLTKCKSCYFNLKRPFQSRAGIFISKSLAGLLSIESQIIRAMIKKHLFTSKSILSTSKTLFDKILSIYPELQNKTRIVGNPIKIEALDKYLRGNREQYYLWAGRLTREKGIIETIKAYLHYRKMGGRAKLVIAGDGPYRSLVNHMSSKIKGIDYIGWVSENRLTQLLSEAKAFLSLTLWHEPFGRIVLTSLYLGTPVISSMFGEPANLVRETTGGALVDPRNPDKISKIMFSIDNYGKELYREFIRKNTKFIRENYSATAVAERYFQTYKIAIK